MKTVKISALLFSMMVSSSTLASSQWALETLKALTESAPIIVLGEVQEVKSQFGYYLGLDDFIFTYVTIRVQRSLKGNAGDQVIIRVHGGQIGAFP